MVVVGEPITAEVKFLLSPEHWIWYSVITPFDVAGALQIIYSDVELSATIEKLRGGPAGTVQHIMSDITVAIVNDVLTIFIRGSTNCCWWTISHYCCCTHRTCVACEWIDLYILNGFRCHGTDCHTTNSAVKDVASDDSILLRGKRRRPGENDVVRCSRGNEFLRWSSRNYISTMG